MREHGSGREGPQISTHLVPSAYLYPNLLIAWRFPKDPAGVPSLRAEGATRSAGLSVRAVPHPDSLTNFTDPHPLKR